jgi:hypothetical protein
MDKQKIWTNHIATEVKFDGCIAQMEANTEQFLYVLAFGSRVSETSVSTEQSV